MYVIIDVITAHNMHFHFYADDTQVFLTFNQADLNSWIKTALSNSKIVDQI